MKIKRPNFIFFTLISLVLFSSCVMDYKPFVDSVRNCTSDTLLIELTESGNFDGRSIFDDKDTSDYTGVDFEYVTEAYIKGKRYIYQNLIMHYQILQP